VTETENFGHKFGLQFEVTELTETEVTETENFGHKFGLQFEVTELTGLSSVITLG
jgi:hypothetical protein